MKKTFGEIKLGLDPNDYYALLGSPDHEMNRCMEVLRRAGVPYAFAHSTHAHRAEETVNAEEAMTGAWWFPPTTGIAVRHRHVLLLELRPLTTHRNQLERWGAQSVLTLDHHHADDPPFSTLHQLSTLLLHGVEGLQIAHFDHDAESAYHYWGDALLAARLRWTERNETELAVARDYVERALTPLGRNLWLGVEPSPTVLVWDVLLSQGQAAFVRVPPRNGEERLKFALGGATRRARRAVQAVFRRCQALGWETYQTRHIGGFYVPPGTEFHPALLTS